MTAFRSVIRIVQSSAQRASQTLRVNNQQQQRNLANYAKPDTSALNEKQTQTLQQFKNAETHAKAVHEQRLMADIAGVPHTDATAYRRVAQRNWITAGLLMAFMGAVYSYSTNRIVTAEDTFTGEEMRSIMAELDQELEEQQAEIEGDSTIGQGGAPTASR